MMDLEIEIEKERAKFRRLSEKIVALAKPKMKAKVRGDLERMFEAALNAALRRRQFTCIQGGKQRKMEKGPYG
jgi:hypothetical protein